MTTDPTPASRNDGQLSMLATLFLICLCVPLFFNVGGLALSPLRVFLLVVFVPLSVSLLSGQYGRISMIDIAVILHLLWVLVALAYNHGARVIESGGINIVELFGSYLVARATIRNKSDFFALARVFGVLLVLLIPFIAIESVTSRNLLLDAFGRVPGFSTYQIATAEPRLGLSRAQGILSHPIHMGIFFSLGFGLSLLVAKRKVVAGISALGAFFSLSSGAFLIVVLQVGLIAWRWITPAILGRWKVLTVLFIIVYIFLEIFSDRTAIMVILSYATFSTHNAYWRTIIFDYGLQNVWSSPIFGIGLNDWFRPDWVVSSSADNYWLLNAMRYGIPGFTFLAAAFIMMIWRVSRVQTDQDDVLDRCRRAWVITIVSVCFSLGTVHIWGPIYSFVFFLFGTGHWLIGYVQESDARSANQPADPQPQTDWGRHKDDPNRYSRFAKDSKQAPAVPDTKEENTMRTRFAREHRQPRLSRKPKSG